MSTPEIVFAGTEGGALTQLADYEAVGGLSALAKARAMTPDNFGHLVMWLSVTQIACVVALCGQEMLVTRKLGQEMEKLDIPPVREFLELISDSGGKIYACKLAMDMFKLKKEDLMDRVDGVLTVGDFYNESAGAGTHILFT